MNVPQQFCVAWCILIHHKIRLFFSIIGIGFAVIILFMEAGFFHGFSDSMIHWVPYMDADLIMYNRRRVYVTDWQKFNIKKMYQARSLDKVESVTPLYTDIDELWNPNGESRNHVFSLGIDLQRPGLLIPGIERYKHELTVPGSILLDQLSRKEIGLFDIGTRSRIGRYPINVVGVFKLGPNFVYESSALMSYTWIRQLNVGFLCECFGGKRLQKNAGAPAGCVEAFL